MKRILIFSLQALSGISMAIWGIGALYPVEPLENRIVEQSLASWNTSPVIARLLIAIMFAYAVLLLFRINPRRAVTGSLPFFILIFLYDIIWQTGVKDKIILKCYACLAGDSIVSYIIYLALLAGSIWMAIRSESSDFSRRWLKYPLIIISLALPFILNPVFPGDFRDRSEPINISFDPGFRTNGTQLLIGFMSTSCNHCKMAAAKIAVASKTGTFPPFRIMFLGSEEGASIFLKEANVDFEYSFLSPERFLELCGPSYPVFQLYHHGKSIRRWDGRTFNYFAVSELGKK